MLTSHPIGRLAVTISEFRRNTREYFLSLTKPSASIEGKKIFGMPKQNAAGNSLPARRTTLESIVLSGGTPRLNLSINCPSKEPVLA